MNARARLKSLDSGQGALVYCGRRALDGRQTCCGQLGVLYTHMHGGVHLKVNEIMAADEAGIYRLRPHAEKQRAAGRKVTLRTRRPLDETGDPRRPTKRDRDLGRLGDNSARGDELRRGPARFVCNECRTVNEVPAAWFETS